VTDYLNANAEGIALAAVIGLIGLGLLLAAIFIEHFVPPRHERRYRHLEAVSKVRQAARQ
jgi:hypothetical protein